MRSVSRWEKLYFEPYVFTLHGQDDLDELNPLFDWIKDWKCLIVGKTIVIMQVYPKTGKKCSSLIFGQREKNSRFVNFFVPLLIFFWRGRRENSIQQVIFALV